jgi:nucleoside-diphosphate-sugar epimerase
MKVLLTGAFGNIGESTIMALLERKHEILCFDLKTKKNKKVRKKLVKLGSFETIWGDISNQTILIEIVKGRECIIHLAGIIPPTSEKFPDLTHRVNVEGTQNIVEAALKMEKRPKFIFTSSISTHGPRMHEPPPRKANEKLNPTDNYTHSKVEAEAVVKKSGLIWTILRLTGAPPLKISLDLDVYLFNMPMDQRVEFVHTRDVGVAIANSVTANTDNKVLLIGGGEKCQMLNREYFTRILEAIGIGMLPESAFKVPKNDMDWYYTDWMDTSEAQELLQFQNLTFEDYLEELKKNLGIMGKFAKLFRSYAQKKLLKSSPYYIQQ